MAKDPYRYFRIEAQDLLERLSQGLLDLEKGADPELVQPLLRFAHTLKGASRVVKRADIGELAHEIEELLSPHRDSGGPVAHETIDQALDLVDSIRVMVDSLGENEAGEEVTESAEPSPTTNAEDLESIRVAVQDVDVLLEDAGAAFTAASALRRSGERLDQIQTHAREIIAQVATEPSLASSPVAREIKQLAATLEATHRGIIEQIDRVTRELTEVRATASALRLVPAKSLMRALERIVRDAARSLDKDVEFHSHGADTDIDAHVLAGLRKALVHVVRNSVAHGIEAPEERRRSGKPERGRIDVSIRRQGHRASITCVDDGRGLDLGSVRAAAIERGLVSSEIAHSMDGNALGRLLLRGGVSTSRHVTDISGRGVGLDAVRDVVETLNGEVDLRSTAGKGTTVEIVVPVSLSTMPALAMSVDDAEVFLPIHSVQRALRISRSDLTRDGDGERLMLDDKVIPFLPLRRTLHSGAAGRWDAQSAVVIHASGRYAALGVDRLGESRTIVVRGIPDHAELDPIVAGAALDDEGVPRLVLAPQALVNAAISHRPVERMPEERPLPPLLVIDDSLTTRMLEQSILESAGYEVDLAVSAEDGLEKARQRRYGVFIVDVEMPGMNGFEFVETTGNDPELRDTPAVLVTSRSDPADKRRGKEVGARAYIVKSQFDQNVLLETIRRLTG